MRGRYAEFSKEEFELRHAQARRLMDSQRLDALLITERLNYCYFSGHRSEQNIVDKIRPYIFVLPREGNPTLLTMKFEMQQVEATTWIEDVRPAGLMDRAEVVIATLKSLGLDKARIGAELGAEQQMGLSYNEFSAIKAAMPNAIFLDAAPIILKMRAVKSPAEIKYITKAGQIVAAAMKETFGNIRAGMTEIEVARILRTLMAEKGGERQTFSWIVSSVDGMYAHPTERKLRAGDVLVLDTGIEFHGYGSDVSRTAFVGEPTNRAADSYNWQTKLTRHTADQLRAGKTPAEVLAACNEMCAERGLVPAIAGRVGHGVGLESTEYPSLAAAEQVVFEPGMVFACNPNFFWPDLGWMNNEDNWVVTADGAPELLSSPIAPEQLFVVKA